MVLALGGVGAGVWMLGLAESAVHEIEGLICLVGSAVLLSGAGIVEAIGKVKMLSGRFKVEAEKEDENLDVKQVVT